MLKNARLPSCQRQHDRLPFDVLGSDLHLLRPLRGTSTKSEESARHNRAQKGCCAFLFTSGGAHAQGGRQHDFNGILSFVMTSCASLPCSAADGKIVAHQKKPIAGFPGSGNRQESVLPGVKPAGRMFCPRQISFAVHPAHACRQQHRPPLRFGQRWAHYEKRAAAVRWPLLLCRECSVLAGIQGYRLPGR